MWRIKRTHGPCPNEYVAYNFLTARREDVGENESNKAPQHHGASEDWDERQQSFRFAVRATPICAKGGKDLDQTGDSDVGG